MEEQKKDRKETKGRKGERVEKNTVAMWVRIRREGRIWTITFACFWTAHSSFCFITQIQLPSTLLLKNKQLNIIHNHYSCICYYCLGPYVSNTAGIKNTQVSGITRRVRREECSRTSWRFTSAISVFTWLLFWITKRGIGLKITCEGAAGSASHSSSCYKTPSPPIINNVIKISEK